MNRILIADGSRVFAAGIEKQLKPDFTVKVFNNGKELLRHIREFQPDIILFDLALPECDPLALIHTIRSSGYAAHIVTISSGVSVAVRKILMDLDITYMLPKPCAMGNAVCFLRQLALSDEDTSDRCVETEIDNILLHLGFLCGRSRYDCTFQAIRLKCCGEAGDSAKYLYSEVRRICGKKTMESVEKAIRDAIGHAWEHGDRDVWLMYFPHSNGGKCPSNEIFISRIAQAVGHMERRKKNRDMDQPAYKFG